MTRCALWLEHPQDGRIQLKYFRQQNLGRVLALSCGRAKNQPQRNQFQASFAHPNHHVSIPGCSGLNPFIAAHPNPKG